MSTDSVVCERCLKWNYLTFYRPMSHHIETSQLICSVNQLTGFYMMGTLVSKGLSCTFLRRLPKVDIAKLILKIGTGNRAK